MLDRIRPYHTKKIVARKNSGEEAVEILKWSNLDSRRQELIVKLVMINVSKAVAHNILDLTFNNQIHSRATRQKNKLHPPAIRTEAAKRSFYYHGF